MGCVLDCSDPRTDGPLGPSPRHVRVTSACTLHVCVSGRVSSIAKDVQSMSAMDEVGDGSSEQGMIVTVDDCLDDS